MSARQNAYEILEHLMGGRRTFQEALLRLQDVDSQSFDVLHATFEVLMEHINIDDNLLEALRRMQYVVENIDRASPALLRNNAFKAGNAAGVRLPSGIFGQRSRTR